MLRHRLWSDDGGRLFRVYNRDALLSSEIAAARPDSLHRNLFGHSPASSGQRSAVRQGHSVHVAAFLHQQRHVSGERSEANPKKSGKHLVSNHFIGAGVMPTLCHRHEREIIFTRLIVRLFRFVRFVQTGFQRSTRRIGLRSGSNFSYRLLGNELHRFERSRIDCRGESCARLRSLQMRITCSSLVHNLLTRFSNFSFFFSLSLHSCPDRSLTNFNSVKSKCVWPPCLRP